MGKVFTHPRLLVGGLEVTAGQAPRRGAGQPKLGERDAAAKVKAFKRLLDAVVMPFAARLPHRRVPELLRITMMWVDVIDDRCRLDPPDGFAPHAERRAGKVGLPRLMPAMIISALGRTATPTVSLPPLLKARRRSCRPELLGPLHCHLCPDIAYALALKR